MSIEEEKKLVAEKLMGWDFCPECGREFYSVEQARTQSIEDWNPHKDRNCWPEVWEKLSTTRMTINYVIYLSQYLPRYKASGTISEWDFHTAPSEICWKALIRTLKEL